jgi:hypothetical protein
MKERYRPQQFTHTAHQYGTDFQLRFSRFGVRSFLTEPTLTGSGEFRRESGDSPTMVRMRSRLRDAILAVTVAASLTATGWALYGLGRRLPPPPEVRSNPAPQVVPDAEH